MAGATRRLHGVAAILFVAGCASSAPPPPVPKPAEPPPPPPLAEVTLQSALEAAWDGDFALCARRSQQALDIVPDDLETMEVAVRCAHASRTTPDLQRWLRKAYAKRPAAIVVRYAHALGALVRGEIGESRKQLDKLASEAPAAAFHAALAAQLDDDVLAAEKAIALYVKANPIEPHGRMVQTEIVCAIDLSRCNSALETVRATDDDETAIARRLGAALGGPAVVPRTRLQALTKEADAIGAAAFSDAFAVAALAREGSDPATILVRSPRSGRPEPGPGVDLVKQARPMSRLPFATRVAQLALLNDAAAPAAHAKMAALFPTELSTWRLAKRWDRAALAARKELEKSAVTRWRAMVATTLARTDESCELSLTFPWTDRGPIATSMRARCEISLDPARGRKIADARLAVLPFGQYDVEVAIEGNLAVRDAVALEALGRSLAKSAPASTLPALSLWAAAEAGAKKQHALYAEALQLSGWDPLLSRRLVQKYVDLHDVPHAKGVIYEALVEAPNDALLAGVLGEILLHEGKTGPALPWLTRSCVSARARREQDVLGKTLSSMAIAIAKAKAPADKAARDAALKCAKGE